MQRFDRMAPESTFYLRQGSCSTVALSVAKAEPRVRALTADLHGHLPSPWTSLSRLLREVSANLWPTIDSYLT